MLWIKCIERSEPAILAPDDPDVMIHLQVGELRVADSMSFILDEYKTILHFEQIGFPRTSAGPDYHCAGFHILMGQSYLITDLYSKL